MERLSEPISPGEHITCLFVEALSHGRRDIAHRPPYSTSYPVMFAIYQLDAVTDFEAC